MKLLSVLLAALAFTGEALSMPDMSFHEMMQPREPLKRAANQLQQVTGSWGSNPTNVGFYIYLPTKLATNPAIIVGIHWCHGNATDYFNGTPYASLADQYGFIVIYPNSPYTSDGCWDLSSQASLTHDGGGDTNSIANMVTYTLSKYSANANKVYVTGVSSGAMMTNLMAATYPELFQAGIVYSGVPAGCFYSSSNAVDAWNSTCAQGEVIATPQTWGNIVRAMYPGYSGSYPKMQIYHGSADTTLYPENYNETIKEWANIFGYDYTKPDTTQANTPLSGYTTYTWGSGKLIGIYAIGVGHTVPVIGSSDMAYFGFT